MMAQQGYSISTDRPRTLAPPLSPLSLLACSKGRTHGGLGVRGPEPHRPWRASRRGRGGPGGARGRAHGPVREICPSCRARACRLGTRLSRAFATLYEASWHFHNVGAVSEVVTGRPAPLSGAARAAGDSDFSSLGRRGSSSPPAPPSTPPLSPQDDLGERSEAQSTFRTWWAMTEVAVLDLLFEIATDLSG
jgi:hypothetical protein